MFRPVSRSLLRSATVSLFPGGTTATKRFLSSAPPHQRSRSFKSTVARWGLAIAGIYYYNTSELFAEQPPEYHLDPKADYEDTGTPTTLDAITQKSRENKRNQQSVLTSRASEDDSAGDNASSQSLQHPEPEFTSTPTSTTDPAGLEDEASTEGAFNPVTGEINWECPCLGGMAHGPCGEEFRAAFSCFVFSEEEPKGMDCINKFQGMQECFRAHPDVYAAELEGDDNEELDEGLEEERKELVKEIQERREKAGVETEESAPSKRLLEVDPPMERKPLLRRPHTESAISSSNTSPPSRSEPQPFISEDHKGEARLKNIPLPTTRQPESNQDTSSQAETTRGEDVELVPREHNDKRSGAIPDKESEK